MEELESVCPHVWLLRARSLRERVCVAPERAALPNLSPETSFWPRWGPAGGQGAALGQNFQTQLSGQAQAPL